MIGTLDKIKMVFLIRDPRATIHSRSKEDWCVEDFGCIIPREVCQGLQEDLESLASMQEAGHEIYLLRYEDLSLDVTMEVGRLFDFLNFEQLQYVDQYLQAHTTVDVNGAYNTQKNTIGKILSLLQVCRFILYSSF